MKSLPKEHIYSYLFRGYKVYGIPAFHTIINSQGLFKRRLATIEQNYLRPFILGCDDLRFVSLRSGFLNASLILEKGYETQVVANTPVPPGLRMIPVNKSQSHNIRYCICCIRSFIYEYGCAYLVADWLGDKDVCERHDCEIVTPEISNRNHAIQTLEKVFCG